MGDFAQQLVSQLNLVISQQAVDQFNQKSQNLTLTALTIIFKYLLLKMVVACLGEFTFATELSHGSFTRFARA